MGVGRATFSTSCIKALLVLLLVLLLLLLLVSAAAARENIKINSFSHFLLTMTELIRVTIHNAHVFKLPPRSSAAGWRGADWIEQVWQGSVQVIEKGPSTAVKLVSLDTSPPTLFAQCPVTPGAVDRCVDSSRYFVLRITNGEGRNMFIGLAFNERNDAFDFNTALSDSERERGAEREAEAAYRNESNGQGQREEVDYTIKGKIHVNINVPNKDKDRDRDSAAARRRANRGGGPTGGGVGGGWL